MLMTSRSAQTRLVLMVMILGMWPHTCTAQSGSGGKGGEFILRTYEVGDLVINIQDRPYSESLQRKTTLPTGGSFGGGGGMGGGGGGFFSVPAEIGENGLGTTGFYAPVTTVMADGGVNANLRFCQFGGGGMGGMASGPPDAPHDPSSITMDDIMRVLVSTVDSESWDEYGGEGRVQPLGTTLVIWQTSDVHRQISDLLSQLRDGTGERRTVSIDARWLLLSSDDLEEMLLPSEDGIPRVERETLRSFTRRPASIRGITNCFSGQLVYLASGTRRNVVSSYVPVVGSIDDFQRGERRPHDRQGALVKFVSNGEVEVSGNESHVGYQPVVEKLNFGALLEIRPTRMRGSNSAIVDLKSTITVPGEKTRGIGAGVSAPPIVDRIAIETQELATTLRVPLGEPVLVGGLTYVPPSMDLIRRDDPAEDDQQAQQGSENAQLYLVLEIR